MRAESLSFFGELLTGRRLDRALSTRSGNLPQARGSESERINRAVALLLARPEAQLS